MTHAPRRVSVLIPAYNAEETIGATIRSALDQTMAPHEVLVVDDGSEDATAQVVTDFAPRVSLISQPNSGVAAARNLLCARACGNVLAFLDSDDLWHPRYLEVVCDAWEANPGAVACMTGHRPFESEAALPARGDDGGETVGPNELMMPRAFLERFHRASGFIYPSFCVVRADVLQNAAEPWFLERTTRDFSEDIYFWYRLALAGPVVFIPRPLGLYRLRPGSRSDDRLLAYGRRVGAIEAVCRFYASHAPPDLTRMVERHLAASHRLVAKHLMGERRSREARRHFVQAVGVRPDLRSLGLLASSFLPRRLQPKWPQRYRPT